MDKQKPAAPIDPAEAEVRRLVADFLKIVLGAFKMRPKELIAYLELDKGARSLLYNYLGERQPVGYAAIDYVDMLSEKLDFTQADPQLRMIDLYFTVRGRTMAYLGVKRVKRPAPDFLDPRSDYIPSELQELWSRVREMAERSEAGEVDYHIKAGHAAILNMLQSYTLLYILVDTAQLMWMFDKNLAMYLADIKRVLNYYTFEVPREI